MNIVIRPAHEGDMPYILGSWVSGTRRNHPHTPWTLHSESMNRRIRALIRRGAAVDVAASPEDSNQIFGWVCFESFTGVDRSVSRCIHWLNVKRTYRRLGIGRLLLKHLNIELREPIIASDHSYIVHQLKDRYTVTVVPQLLEGLDL